MIKTKIYTLNLTDIFEKKIWLNDIVPFSAFGQNAIFVSLGASICLDVISIETLDLDISKS
jgi:hypothetical protein